MDTKNLEEVAENFISGELQRAGLLVAKPKFDQKGTDLLVFAEMQDEVKFCRVQCKGRRFGADGRTQIVIPSEYVTNGFLLILYLDAGEWHGNYYFLASEIQQWDQTPRGAYRLAIKKSKAKDDLKRNAFDTSKIDLIKLLIREAETRGEFHRLVYGDACITLPAYVIDARGTSGAGSR
jgi:hypothetical protein